MPRRLDGLLLLDKPAGISSHAALQEARRLCGAAKAGHAGTLDPLASGLLPILLGEATKLAQYLLDSDKEYLAEARLGVTTTTGDAEGAVLERRAVRISEDAIERALERFRGEIDQIPPMHSALKRDGRPLYRLAREGASVERAPRRVTVHALEFLGRNGDCLRLRVRCSKGTYVRTLVEDIGTVLGSGAHLAALRRTAAGRLRIGGAVTLQALAALEPAARVRHVLPLDSMLEDLPSIVLPAESVARFRQGQALAQTSALRGRCRVCDGGGRLLGVGEVGEDGRLQPRRLLASG